MPKPKGASTRRLKSYMLQGPGFPTPGLAASTASPRRDSEKIPRYFITASAHKNRGLQRTASLSQPLMDHSVRNSCSQQLIRKVKAILSRSQSAPLTRNRGFRRTLCVPSFYVIVLKLKASVVLATAHVGTGSRGQSSIRTERNGI